MVFGSGKTATHQAHLNGSAQGDGSHTACWDGRTISSISIGLPLSLLLIASGASQPILRLILATCCGP
jgi:hypothetical protein